MADHLTPKQRSKLMSAVKGKNTKPELLVRSLLHRNGFRFTVNGPQNRKLPGHPDIVLPKYKTVVFVHGCFWHCHKKCGAARIPSTNVTYWKKKLERNVERDEQNLRQLRKQGWRAIVVWECELKKTGQSFDKDYFRGKKTESLR